MLFRHTQKSTTLKSHRKNEKTSPRTLRAMVTPSLDDHSVSPGTIASWWDRNR